MSYKMPLFTSAPRIRLSLDGVNIGFAVGFNINLSIDVQPVYTIGQYNAAYLEPTMYNPVTGTIQILRLKGKYDGRTNNTVNGAGHALGHLDPSIVVATALFDMDVYMKVPEFASDNTKSKRTIFTSDEGAAVLKDGVYAPTDYVGKTAHTSKIESFVPGSLSVSNPTAGGALGLWMQIRDVRLTSRNANITLGQIVNEPVSFQGLMLVGEVGEWKLDEKVVQGAL